MSAKVSSALVPFLNGAPSAVAWVPDAAPTGCPADLLDWLRRCNGLFLDDGTWLLGIGDHLDDLLQIEVVLAGYPNFAERGWWPVASDGCGNYWVLTELGVGFVDCAEGPDQLAYLVSSSLDKFLVPFLIPFLDRKGWPFRSEVVEGWDPLVLRIAGK